MNPGQRLKTIQRVAASLASEQWTDIDLTLRTFGMRTADEWSGNSYDYVVNMVEDAEDEDLVRIDAHLAGHDLDVAKINLIWRKDELRLFVSHISKYKVEAKELADALSRFGIHAFVAHEDIEPNKSWSQTIVDSLRTCDALVALVHPEFHDSLWCDQEVGWVLGREQPVLSVRKGKDPYGIFGSTQAINGGSKGPAALTVEIVRVLLGIVP